MNEEWDIDQPLKVVSPEFQKFFVGARVQKQMYGKKLKNPVLLVKNDSWNLALLPGTTVAVSQSFEMTPDTLIKLVSKCCCKVLFFSCFNTCK
jgi:hypothetical protein